jgi:hypothetical protein
MDEQAVRALVREVVARQVGSNVDPEPARLLPLSSHISHYRYALPASDGPCRIEPTVQCTHCGYCESHGH